MNIKLASIACILTASLVACAADQTTSDDADVDTGALGKLVGSPERARQRRTMTDMRAIATANATMRVDMGKYASRLQELADNGYIQVVPTTDGWGTQFTYTSSDGGSSFSLTSLGADGRVGPAAPTPWSEGPYDPDITMRNGQFTQAPAGR